MYFKTKSPIVTELIVFNTKQIEKNDSLIEEEWEIIKYNGEETNYEISNYGQVYNTLSGKYLTPIQKTSEK